MHNASLYVNGSIYTLDGSVETMIESYHDFSTIGAVVVFTTIEGWKIIVPPQTQYHITG